MKLGLNIGYSGARIELPLELIRYAESLGYDSVWTAEAYGSDAVTPLAYLAALTSRIRLGTAVMQIPARTPAMTAMTMSTLDQLSGGRVMVGLGLSGPQVVEGWHGVPYGRPAVRMREYVQILRKIWARDEPVSFDGEECQLPYRGPGATGLGKPLKSILHGRQLPVYLATMGPVNIRTTAELADGWLPIWFSPRRMPMFRPHLEEGFRRAGNGKSWKDFDIAAGCTVAIGDDVGALLAAQKPFLALYIGGMGAREKNFHNEMAIKYGYGDAAKRIQELYLAGRKREAEEAVPDELADEMSLVGPVARIRERFRDWEDAGVTTLLVQSRQPEALRLMAELTGADRGAAVQG
ncbi:LLM class F420-dependent oxidoreductase [Tepidiforma sp.]|jgi:F420-dependent oxidoreductase-like protein|uniref:LLM class F420-dependent oxidoreductase n=1 Tax=Tepidiforma sp. TaxID=2682230 RepID=UPI0026259741|nr:LLM class F420-dependent oxidoreductase [Tepidiforma sp.]MCX7616813.1 LLM class F420-dependent oxidoreductase [Tepidiforma sp.]